MFGAPIGCYIDDNGEQIINNIYQELKKNPNYANYNIYKGEDDASTYIIISHLGRRLINRFSFYGVMGKLNSIAIYGVNLSEHYCTIKLSGEFYGLPVSEVNWEGDYVDVFLQ